MRVWSLGWEDSLEEGMATHSNNLAWRIPWTEEPGRLYSMESHRVKQLKRLSTAHIWVPIVCVHSIHSFSQGDSFYFLEFVWFFQMVFKLFLASGKIIFYKIEFYVVDQLLSRVRFPVLHYLPEFSQTQVHWVSDAIQPSHPLSPLSPPALSLSQHQVLFQWVGSSHQVSRVSELNFNLVFFFPSKGLMS